MKNAMRYYIWVIYCIFSYEKKSPKNKFFSLDKKISFFLQKDFSKFEEILNNFSVFLQVRETDWDQKFLLDEFSDRIICWKIQGKVFECENSDFELTEKKLFRIQAGMSIFHFSNFSLKHVRTTQWFPKIFSWDLPNKKTFFKKNSQKREKKISCFFFLSEFTILTPVLIFSLKNFVFEEIFSKEILWDFLNLNEDFQFGFTLFDQRNISWQKCSKLVFLESSHIVFSIPACSIVSTEQILWESKRIWKLYSDLRRHFPKRKDEFDT